MHYDILTMERPSLPQESVTNTSSNLDNPIQHGSSWPDTQLISALNLKRRDLESSSATPSEGSVPGVEEKMDTNSSSNTSLYQKFKENPAATLELLQRVLPADKLASLISSERAKDHQQLEVLQTKLQEAHRLIKSCSEQKEGLVTSIDETSERIKKKRKQLEDLREELKVLSEEEIRLKKKRDISYQKCLDYKLKLKSSREALQQLSELSKTSSPYTVTDAINKSA
ncbi:hypothetical protein EMCRGX_G026974 [Ephydatia muelleri]